MRKRFNCDALENEGVRELTADEMADVQGAANLVEYALLIGGIALIAAASVSVFGSH
jgi:hypothetical protein